MATVNFSVPEEVKEAFRTTFAGENRSAIVASLLMQAVEERRRQEQRAKAIDALLELRRRAKPARDARIRAARHKGRP